jgi:N-methylhydantoinase B/oxoprolinase/acetone carboxylase alpha subunit
VAKPAKTAKAAKATKATKAAETGKRSSAKKNTNPARSAGEKGAALRPGDHVQWRTSQGPTTGVVERKLTEPADVKGHHAAASADNPEYLVESDKSRAQAIHKPAALKKLT